MKRKIQVFTILILIVLILFAVFFAHTSSRKGDSLVITIPSGSSVIKVASILSDEEVIKSKTMFRLYVKIKESEDKIQAGMHTFSKGMSYSDCLNELLSPTKSGETVTVTLPEGYEVHQIAELLEKKGVCPASDFMDAVKRHTFDYEFLHDLPKREIPLEGYLFPDTYEFYLNSKPEDCIRTMLDRFDSVLYTKENCARAKEMGYSFDEMVTMASVVEREAAGDADRATVASVFYNRLASNYRYLESCATVQYILGERKAVLSYDDTHIDSPYNTYRYEGLPIGPIASVGEESFRAALYPAKTEYRYFVMGKNGEHIFSKTYEEHLKAQE